MCVQVLGLAIDYLVLNVIYRPQKDKQHQRLCYRKWIGFHCLASPYRMTKIIVLVTILAAMTLANAQTRFKRSLQTGVSWKECIESNQYKYWKRTKYGSYGTWWELNSQEVYWQSGDSYTWSNTYELVPMNSPYFLWSSSSYMCGLQELLFTTSYSSHYLSINDWPSTYEWWYSFTIDYTNFNGLKIDIGKIRLCPK